MARDILGEIAGLPESEVWEHLEAIAREAGVEDVPTLFPEFIDFLDTTPAVRPDESMVFDLSNGEPSRCLFARYGNQFYRICLPIRELKEADWWDGLAPISPVEARKEMARALRRAAHARPSSS